MAIDLLNLQPTTISRDLKGKYICLFGKPKYFGHCESISLYNGVKTGTLRGESERKFKFKSLNTRNA